MARGLLAKSFRKRLKVGWEEEDLLKEGKVSSKKNSGT